MADATDYPGIYEGDLPPEEGYGQCVLRVRYDTLDTPDDTDNKPERRKPREASLTVIPNVSGSVLTADDGTLIVLTPRTLTTTTGDFDFWAMDGSGTNPSDWNWTGILKVDGVELSRFRFKPKKGAVTPLSREIPLAHPVTGDLAIRGRGIAQLGVADTGDLLVYMTDGTQETVPIPKLPGPIGPTGPKGDPGGWVGAPTLNGDENLNTVTSPGTYLKSAGGGATLANNWPVANWAGYLHVTQPSINGSTYVLQVGYPLISGTEPWNPNASVWFRTMYGAGVWKPWQRLAPAGSTGGSDLTGSGQPNGVVTAPPGVYYTDVAQTAGAIRWFKSTGTGNTGWVVITGDTGWRDVSSWLTSDWVPGKTVPLVRARRTTHGCWVELRISPTSTLIGQSQTLSGPVMNLPVGFIPSNYTVITPVTTGTSGTHIITNASSRAVLTIGPNASLPGTMLWAASHTCQTQMQFHTVDPWPTTLPGTPV